MKRFKPRPIGLDKVPTAPISYFVGNYVHLILLKLSQVRFFRLARDRYMHPFYPIVLTPASAKKYPNPTVVLLFSEGGIIFFIFFVEVRGHLYW